MKKYFLFYFLFYSLIVSAQANLQTATYRPDFHFAPKQNWINDPNGLVYKKGVYHMYFQYNPFADVWGQTGFSERFPGTESAPLIAGAGDIKFRILIDHSLVEVFIDDGAALITDLVFPNNANGGIEFFSSSGNTAIFKNIKIWKMKGEKND